MATSTAQRTGIWIIAIVLIVGTLAGFVAMILAPQNQAADSARLEKVYAKYQKDNEEYQAKVTAQADELSQKYYGNFSEYQNEAGEFDKDSVKELSTRDLEAGSGETVTKDSKYAIYYLGWNPSGKVFDSSLDDGKLKAPLVRESEGNWIFPGGQQGGVIEGWEKGILGMKIGGVRELTLTSDLAYGETGSGEDIPANTPLKFIVMIIEKPETIKQPEIPKELMQSYGG